MNSIFGFAIFFTLFISVVIVSIICRCMRDIEHTRVLARIAENQRSIKPETTVIEIPMFISDTTIVLEGMGMIGIPENDCVTLGLFIPNNDNTTI